MPNRSEQQNRIKRAATRFMQSQKAQFEPRRRYSTAYVTSVNRDPVSDHVTGVRATIAGVTDQFVFTGYGSGVKAGDVLRVENRGSALAPDWTMIGKTSSAGGGDGIIDVDRILSTPTGLGLSSAIYSPSPNNLRASLAASWTQVADWESPSHYVVELRRDSNTAITSTQVDHEYGASPNTASVTWQDLEPNVAYSVRVRAAGYGNARSGWTAWSSQTTAVDTTAPDPITGEGSEVLAPGKVKLYWSASTAADLSHYEFDLSIDASTSLPTYPRNIGKQTSFIVDTVPGMGFYWRVRAVDTSGNAEAWSGVSWLGPVSSAEPATNYGVVFLNPYTELRSDMNNSQTTMTVARQLFGNDEFVALANEDGEVEIVITTSAGSGNQQSGYSYNITRNQGSVGDFGLTAPVAHGAAYTKAYRLGQTGYIAADTRSETGDGYPANPPYIDIHAFNSPFSSTWTDKTHAVRLGELAGIYDLDFGGWLTGYGLYSTNAYLKGTLALSAGSAASPSLVFVDENNTGFYWTEDVGNYSNRLHISLNGTESLNFNETSAGIHEVESPAHLRMQSTSDGNIYFYSDSNWLATFFSPFAGDRFAVKGPLDVQEGSVTSPHYSFSGDSDSGWYLASAGNVALSVGGVARITQSTTSLTVSEPIRGPLGDTGAPTYSFSGDTNTGIYGDGSGDVIIVADGSTALRTSPSWVRVYKDFELPDGSAAAPSIAYQLDTTTGLYRSGTNRLSVAAGGTQVAEFRYNSGNVRGEMVLNGDIGVISDNGDVIVDSLTGSVYIAGGTGFNYIEGDIRQQTNGSAASPSYTWSNDIDTGMYLSGTNHIGFATGGTRVFDIQDNVILSEVQHIFETWTRIYEDTAPASNPPVSSAYVYLDTADGAYKIRFDNGTIVTIASP